MGNGCILFPLQGEEGNLLAMIDELTTTENRQEVATNLVKLFLGQGLAKHFLNFVIKLELDRTSKKLSDLLHTK